MTSELVCEEHAEANFPVMVLYEVHTRVKAPAESAQNSLQQSAPFFFFQQYIYIPCWLAICLAFSCLPEDGLNMVEPADHCDTALASQLSTPHC